MNVLLEKISSYRIFNYLVPGVMFGVVATEITSFKFYINNIAIDVFIFYFLGLIVSRFGSIIIEPILKNTKLVEGLDYSDFIKASSLDGKIEILTEQIHAYRTSIALFMSLILFFIYDKITQKICLGHNGSIILFSIIFVVIFIFSYRKQHRYLKVRVEEIINNSDAQ